MSLKNGVKCGRCDRRYSVLRGKCPYCGARRSKAGKRVGGSDNSTWTLIVGLLILLVLVVAVVVLLVTTLSNAKEETPPVIDNGPQLPVGDGVDIMEDPDDPAAPVVPDEPVVPDTPDTPDEGQQVGQAITSVKMICFGAELSKSADSSANYDISMGVGDVLNISYETTPALEDLDVKWESADQNIVMVLQSGQVTAVGRGTTKVTLTINGAMATCIVRVG